jgi:hypothetical protein
MHNINSNGAAARAVAWGRGCASACFALALLFTLSGGAARARDTGAQTQGQSGRVPPKLQQPQQTKPNEEEDEDEDEGESVSEAGAVPARPQATDPGTILRRARFIYVRSDSTFVSGEEVEASLQKRKEFKAWGMVITRSEAQADLVIQITRRPLTRRFTFSVINPATMEVVASGKTRSVLFGKKIPNKIAEKFANRVKVYRPYQ